LVDGLANSMPELTKNQSTKKLPHFQEAKITHRISLRILKNSDSSDTKLGALGEKDARALKTGAKKNFFFGGGGWAVPPFFPGAGGPGGKYWITQGADSSLLMNYWSDVDGGIADHAEKEIHKGWNP